MSTSSVGARFPAYDPDQYLYEGEEGSQAERLGDADADWLSQAGDADNDFSRDGSRAPSPVAGARVSAGSTDVGAKGPFGGWVDDRAPSPVAGPKANASTYVGAKGTFGGWEDDGNGSDADDLSVGSENGARPQGEVDPQVRAQYQMLVDAGDDLVSFSGSQSAHQAVIDSLGHLNGSRLRNVTSVYEGPQASKGYRFLVEAPKYICAAIGWSLGMTFGANIGAGVGAAAGAFIGSAISLAIELLVGKYFGYDPALQNKSWMEITATRLETAAVFTFGAFAAGVSCQLVTGALPAMTVHGSVLKGLVAGGKWALNTVVGVVAYTGGATAMRGCLFYITPAERAKWKEYLKKDLKTALYLSSAGSVLPAVLAL